jgi:ribosomal protein L31E
MAEKTEKKEDKKLDRTYIIPVRKLSKSVARWRRAKRAMYSIRKFLTRHMKCDIIKLGKELNELVWERGGSIIPAKVEVHAVREEGITRVNLIDYPLPMADKKEDKEKKEEAKKEENKKEEAKAETKKAPHETKTEEHKHPKKSAEETEAKTE